MEKKIFRRSCDWYILRILRIRELSGYVNLHTKARIFKSLPSRLVFKLSEVVSYSDLENGHIFLGFSKCGQFLISYTQTVDESDHPAFLPFVYKYRLHWWRFVPYRRAERVAEIPLFGDQKFSSILFLSINYWPVSMKRILIYGYSDKFEESSQTGHCYLTITTVPCLNACTLCQAIKIKQEEVLYENGEQLMNSCLQHGMTVHTNYDVVRPFPKFYPHISMKIDDIVVLNTGNFLHILGINTESFKLQYEEQDHLSLANRTYECIGNDKITHSGKLASLNTSTESEDVTWLYSPNTGIEARSPLVTHEKDSLSSSSCNSEDHHIDDAKCFPNNFDSNSRPIYWSVKKKAMSCACRSNYYSAYWGSFNCISPSYCWNSCSISNYQSSSELEYEFTDGPDEASPVLEKLSTFRKRRLADKKYEFSDENSENSIPLFHNRYNKLHANENACKDICSENVTFVRHNISSDFHTFCVEGDKILKPVNHYSKNKILSKDKYELKIFSSNSTKKKQESSVLNKEGSQWVIEFLRQYVEVEDELLSVITDIEDEDFISDTGYHHALPIEVHGSAYNQLQMVSKSKADRLMCSSVAVRQLTLDLEQFCHEVAEGICTEAGKQYWFCVDFDVEIVDIWPDPGEVVCVAVMLLQASAQNRMQNKSSNERNGSQRKQYQTSFQFVWRINNGQHQLINIGQLIESDYENVDIWHPAKQLSNILRQKCCWGPLTSTDVKVMTNTAELQGSLIFGII